MATLALFYGFESTSFLARQENLICMFNVCISTAPPDSVSHLITLEPIAA